MPVLAECHPQVQHTEDILQHGYHYRIHPALHKLDHPEKSYTCPHDRPLKYSPLFSYRKQVPLHRLELHMHNEHDLPCKQDSFHLLFLPCKQFHRCMMFHPEKSYTRPHDRPLKYSLPFSYRKQVPLHCLGLHRHKGNSPPHRQGNLHLLLLLYKESHRNMLRMTQFLILRLMPALRQATDLRAYINLKKSLIFVVSFSLLLFSLIFQSCVTRLG